MSTINFQSANAQEQTPSDTDNLLLGGATPVAGQQQNWPNLYVGTGGDVKVTMAGNGQVVTFKNVPDGCFMPIFVKRVWSTGTTATDILALY